MKVAIISSLFISCARFKLSNPSETTKKPKNCFFFVIVFYIIYKFYGTFSLVVMSDNSDRRAQANFSALFQNIANGSTGFAKAVQNIEAGHFDGKAISLELRAVKRNEPGYTLIQDPSETLPPLRFPIGGHLTLPFDPENRKAFVEWFFASLTAGRRLCEPLYQSQDALTVDGPSRDDIVAVNSASAPRLKKKPKKPSSTAASQPTIDQDEDFFPVRLSKSRTKRAILSDDEDETVDAPQPANPPRKKEKKGKRRVSLPTDGQFDYENDDGNLAGFVVPDDECY